MAIDKTLWNGRTVVSNQHIPKLEQDSALNEFAHNMPRAEAEEKAYSDYRRGEHQRAAAHHLRGIKSSQGSGDRNEALKHSSLYQLHMEKLGLDPWKETPPEIQLHMNDENKPSVYKFKATPGDALVLDEHRVKPSEPIAKSLNRLYVKATEALAVLIKTK